MSNIIVPFAESTYGILLFAMMLIVVIISSNYLLNKLFKLMESRRTAMHRFKRIIRLMQYSIYAIAVSILIQILFFNEYFTLSVILVVTISYSCSIVGGFLVASKLFVWSKHSKNKFSFLFGMAISLIFINSIISLALFNLLLFEKPPVITYGTPVEFTFECNQISFYCDLKQALINYQTYTVMAYFFLFWASNLFFLHHHIKKLGWMKFITFTTLPLILLYFQFFYQYEDLYSINQELKFDENLIYAIQIFLLLIFFTSCGILYGLGLKSVSRLFKFSPIVEGYLRMASLGIIFFITCANSTVAGIGIPPFGIPSILFIPFAVILLYVGIYYSLVAISNDISVRRFIKNSTFNELKIMGSLAQSQMIDSMKDKVMRMTKKYSEELHQQSNSEIIESEEDLQSYLDEAIKIFKKNDNTRR